MQRNYQAIIILGMGLFGYIYFLKFDNFSETALVQITPLWFLPLIFGINGLVAEKLIELVNSGEAPHFRRALLMWIGYFFGFLGFIPLFPFLFIKGKSSLGVALWATAIWGMFLGIFLFGIFPIL